jgi:hypothetical protein
MKTSVMTFLYNEPVSKSDFEPVGCIPLSVMVQGIPELKLH